MKPRHFKRIHSASVSSAFYRAFFIANMTARTEKFQRKHGDKKNEISAEPEEIIKFSPEEEAVVLLHMVVIVMAVANAANRHYYKNPIPKRPLQTPFLPSPNSKMR